MSQHVQLILMLYNSKFRLLFQKMGLTPVADVGIRVRYVFALHVNFYFHYAATALIVAHHIGKKLVGEQFFQGRFLNVCLHVFSFFVACNIAVL